MYLARLRDPAGSDSVRIVVARDPVAGPWSDVRRYVYLDALKSGALRDTANQLSSLISPESLTRALNTGRHFHDAVHGALDDETGDSWVVGDLVFACPVDPPVFRDFMVFEQHFSFGAKWRGVEVPGVLYEFPVSYNGSAASFVGPDAEISWPSYSSQMDYELELGVVIGRAGRNIRPDEARDHILGVTILNDLSARDMQSREMAAGLGPCKGKHFANAAGPWIASLDELDVNGLEMSAFLNGEQVAEASSSEMIWSVEELVAWASAGEPLPAGSLLGSGTANGGSGLEAGRYMIVGDTIELRITGLGSLSNTIVNVESVWTPPMRVVT